MSSLRAIQTLGFVFTYLRNLSTATVLPALPDILVDEEESSQRTRH